MAKKLFLLAVIFGLAVGGNVYWRGVKRFDLRSSTQVWVVEKTKFGDPLNHGQMKELFDLAEAKGMAIEPTSIKYEWQKVALKTNNSATFMIHQLSFRHRQMSWCPFVKEDAETTADVVINTAVPNTPEWVAPTPSLVGLRAKGFNTISGSR